MIWLVVAVVALLAAADLTGSLRGQAKSLDEFTAAEESAVYSAVGIDSDCDFELATFQFMTFPFGNSFYVVELQTQDAGELCADLAGVCDVIEPLPSLSAEYIIFPVQRYSPSGRLTAYTDGESVYLSVWSWNNEELSDLFWQLEEQRERTKSDERS